MKWNTEYFGFRLLVFVGFCGEVPVALLRKAGGCYDYRRRVVTELVRTGYLKERRFRGERRHVIRSLSLTSRGLNQNPTPLSRPGGTESGPACWPRLTARGTGDGPSGSAGTPPACCWPTSWGPVGSRAGARTTPGGRSWSITAPMS